MKNNSVLNKEQEQESRSCSLFNTDLSFTKGGRIQQSYKIELKKKAIHPDHKKLNSAERVSIESRSLPKIIWEQEVNSKKMKKKILLTKTDLLSKCIPKCIPNIIAGYCCCLKYSGDNTSRICLEFDKIPSIKLSNLTS